MLFRLGASVEYTKHHYENIGTRRGIFAFLLCLIGGLWILLHVGSSKDDAVWSGIGLYFIGKAFFIGPMLLVAAEQLGRGANVR